MRERVAAPVRLLVNGEPVTAPSDVTVAVALLAHGVWAFHASVTGTPRAPLCGMGSCHECRVTIDGVAHQRACLTLVRDGMRVETAAATSPSVAQTAARSVP